MEKIQIVSRIGTSFSPRLAWIKLASVPRVQNGLHLMRSTAARIGKGDYPIIRICRCTLRPPPFTASRSTFRSLLRGTSPGGAARRVGLERPLLQPLLAQPFSLESWSWVHFLPDGTFGGDA